MHHWLYVSVCLPEVRCSTSEAKRICIVHVRLEALHINFSDFSQQATFHFLSPCLFPLDHLSLSLSLSLFLSLLFFIHM